MTRWLESGGTEAPMPSPCHLELADGQERERPKSYCYEQNAHAMYVVGNDNDEFASDAVPDQSDSQAIYLGEYLGW